MWSRDIRFTRAMADIQAWEDAALERAGVEYSRLVAELVQTAPDEFRFTFLKIALDEGTLPGWEKEFLEKLDDNNSRNWPDFETPKRLTWDAINEKYETAQMQLLTGVCALSSED